MVRICFVCLGNICRSPTAEGVMQGMLADADLEHRIEVDSAGTAAYHAGEAADERSASTALERGVRLTSVARLFVASDFERFDYVVAMDRENRQVLRSRAPGPEAAAKIVLLRAFALDRDRDREEETDVPDPYYGGPGGFDRVFEICESGCAGLLAHVRAQHDL